jgi:adenylate cyclase
VVLVLDYFVSYSPGSEIITPKFNQVMQDNLFASLGAGLLIGLLTGLAELYLFQRLFKKMSFLMLFISKMIVYMGSIALIGVTITFIYNIVQHELDVLGSAERTLSIFTSANFYHLLMLGIYISLLLNFILIIKNKIGHTSFIPIIMGKYHKPKEEDRIFLFLDLRSSTQTAEKLGHKKYSELIQDCFNDLSTLIIKHRGSVYQFVGDEAVITWRSRRRSNFASSVSLFYTYQDLLQSKSHFYNEKYGVIPEFKGALNSGNVMVAEVGGQVKSEIAYHGDVLNTTARLLELCNVYNKNLMCSDQFKKLLTDIPEDVKIEFHEGRILRGKNNSVDVLSISRRSE